MRTCASPACSSSLEHLRSDAKYCSENCSRDTRRGAASVRRDADRAERLWSGYRRPRARRRPGIRDTQRVRRAAA